MSGVGDLPRCLVAGSMTAADLPTEIAHGDWAVLLADGAGLHS